MSNSTTIKVSIRTRDSLRQLAEREGLTLDAQLRKLILRERRRILGAQLAGAPLDEDDQAVLDATSPRPTYRRPSASTASSNPLVRTSGLLRSKQIRELVADFSACSAVASLPPPGIGSVWVPFSAPLHSRST